MLKILARVGNVTFAHKFASEVLVKHYRPELAAALAALCARVGWIGMEHVISAVLAGSYSSGMPVGAVALLTAILAIQPGVLLLSKQSSMH